MKFRSFDYLDNQIQKGGVLLGCYLQNKLIACGLLEIPSSIEINFISDLFVNKNELNQFALLGFLMVHPSYRGNHLQIILTHERIRYAKEKGYKHIYTSIAPENTFSILNLQKIGFEIIKEIKNIEGNLRYILYKKI